MIIVLSVEQTHEREMYWVNSLLEAGLDLFHIRKPAFSEHEITNYVLAIQKKFRRQLVLHSHHHMAAQLGICRLHFREEERMRNPCKQKENGTVLSTSVHHIDDYNALDDIWSYAFLSPLFPSISKEGYGVGSGVLDSLAEKKNPDVKLVGLGGITPENRKVALAHGADGVALLGSIWQSNHPLKTFERCKR